MGPQEAAEILPEPDDELLEGHLAQLLPGEFPAPGLT
jgi:hypothetical protein